MNYLRQQSIKNGFLLFGALFFSCSANAAIFSYDLQNLGGNRYSYTYAIENNGSLAAGANITEFQLLFDPIKYDELSLSFSNNGAFSTDWVAQFLTSAPGIPATFDIYTLGNGIQVGERISGFSVDFIWLGLGLPGTQEFQIYDANTLGLLETGASQPIQSVPLPLAWPLFLSGLAGMSYLSRTRRSLVVATQA